MEAPRQLARLEVAAVRGRHHVVELEPRRLEQLARHLELDPGRGLELGLMILSEIYALAAPRAPHDSPAIARKIGAVDDEGADRALARRLLELVGPAPVIRERLSLEEARILRGRLVDDHQRDLALEVDTLVAVPAI